MKATIKKSFAAFALPAFAALALLGTTATSDAGMYIKIGDIKGEAEGNSQDAKHKEWIEILSISQSVFRAPVTDAGTGVTRRRGDVILDDVVCTKFLDKASPKLAEAVCNGHVFPEVTIDLTVTVQEPQPDGTVKNKQEPYLTFELKDVIITGYSFHGNAAGEPLPTEEMTLAYTEIKWTYKVLDKDTKVPTGEEVVGQCTEVPSNP